MSTTVSKKTAFVLVTNASYFPRAKRTILDLRSVGQWHQDLVLITVGFDLNPNFKRFYRIQEVQFPRIDVSTLVRQIPAQGFSEGDGREVHKLTQWEKLHVFDDFFLQWSRVVFLDAGLRILDSVEPFLALDYKGRFLAPTDGRRDYHPPFSCQISLDFPDRVTQLVTEFGASILEETYFLNCIWIYDTDILHTCNKPQLIEAMNTHCLCKTNEMGIMNLLLHFKYRLWTPFPENTNTHTNTHTNKILFDWHESNNPGTHWTDYCALKYSATLSFNDC